MKVFITQSKDGVTVCVPAEIAKQLHLEPGTSVDAFIEDGCLVIGAGRKRYTIDELLAGITENNLHPETDWGPPVGREVW